MAWQEYHELYIQAQKNDKAPYHTFSFDLKNSKSNYNDTQDKNYETRCDIIRIFDLFIQNILQKEKEYGHDIFIKDSPITFAPTMIKKISNDYPVNNNPAIYGGDSYHFHIHNGSISDEEFVSIFQEILKSSNNKYEFHFFSSNFETLNYNERNNKYYMGYCILENSENKDNVLLDITANNITCHTKADDINNFDR